VKNRQRLAVYVAQNGTMKLTRRQSKRIRLKMKRG